MKILIVEQDKLVCEQYKRTLENKGHDTVCSASCQETLNIVWEYDFDLFLCNIELPDCNGFELKQFVKKTGQESAFVFLSDQPAKYEFLKAKQSNAFALLSKPISNSDLTLVVDNHSRAVIKPLRTAFANLYISYRGIKRRLFSLVNNCSVGRTKHNDILIPNPRISAHHLLLVRMYEENKSFYRLIDGGLGGKSSTNGVMLNECRVRQYSDLKNGDVIQIPDTIIEYSLANQERSEHGTQT